MRDVSFGEALQPVRQRVDGELDIRRVACLLLLVCGTFLVGQRARLLRLVFEPFLGDCGVAQHHQRTRHVADLVACLRVREIDVHPAAGDPAGRRDDSFQSAAEAAGDHDAEQNEQHRCAEDDRQRHPRHAGQGGVDGGCRHGDDHVP